MSTYLSVGDAQRPVIISLWFIFGAEGIDAVTGQTFQVGVCWLKQVADDPLISIQRLCRNPIEAT